MSTEERRSETRLRSKGIVTLLPEGHAPIPCHIFDVSPSGLGVGLETPVVVDPGTPVAIDGPGFAAHGVVRYCYHMGQVFRIGIELKPLKAV